MVDAMVSGMTGVTGRGLPRGICAEVLVCADEKTAMNNRQAQVEKALIRILHLVLAKVVVTEAFQPLAQFVAAYAVGEIRGLLGVL